jgi:hypothetical protein
VEVTTTLHDDFAIQTRDGKVAAGAGDITMHMHLLPLDGIALAKHLALELELADAHGVVGPFLAVDLGQASEAVEYAFHRCHAVRVPLARDFHHLGDDNFLLFLPLCLHLLFNQVVFSSLFSSFSLIINFFLFFLTVWILSFNPFSFFIKEAIAIFLFLLWTCVFLI